MKRILVVLCGASLAVAGTIHGQVKASLEVSVSRQFLESGDKVIAQLSVDIAPKWHIASITQPDGGPVRTAITLAAGQPFILAGPITGPKPKIEHSEAFGINVETHEGTITFMLPLEATARTPVGIKVAVEFSYQACTDENCMLPKTDTVSTILKPSPPTAKASSATSEWLTDFDEARKLAKRAGKKLLLDFTGSDWCSACIKLEQEVFTTPEFQRFASGYVLVRLDYPRKSAQSADQKIRNATLQQRYAVKGFPTLVLADADGRELVRLVGYDSGAGPGAHLARLDGLLNEP